MRLNCYSAIGNSFNIAVGNKIKIKSKSTIDYSLSNLTTLTDLLNQDRLALDRFVVDSFSETPLHVAAMLGHLDFAKEILRRKLELAQELDSTRSSPLHLASAKGCMGIVKELLRVNPDMCYALDRDGRNPIHLAAMKGLVGVLRELVREAPSAARATVDEGGTVSHLCVNHDQLEAIKVLVEIMDDYDQFLNAKDDYGMTILHLAVGDKQIEVRTAYRKQVWQDDSASHRQDKQSWLSRLPFQRRFFMWLLTGIMNLEITSIAFTYAESIFIFTPKDQESSVNKVIKYGIFAWSIVMSVLLLLQRLRLLEILIDKLMPKRREY
ncbi:hypothetical protein ACLB2K_014696 [Fragaria x ananassa]